MSLPMKVRITVTTATFQADDHGQVDLDINTSPRKGAIPPLIAAHEL